MHKYRVYPDGEVNFEDEFSECDPRYDDFWEGEIPSEIESHLIAEGADNALYASIREIRASKLALEDHSTIFNRGRMQGLLEALAILKQNNNM